MIQLTRLNNHAMALNSDLIKFVEQAPDTVITLTTGEKLVVRESAEEIIQRVVQFRRQVLAELGLVERVISATRPVTADGTD
jgi:flagellar protein FlbD